MPVQFEDLKVPVPGKNPPVREDVNGDMTSKDLNDTNDAMWQCRSDAMKMLEDLTLNEHKTMNGHIAEMKQKMRAPAAGC